MKRIVTTPRPDWQQKVESVGLLFHTSNGQPYWDESAYYEFTIGEVDTLESATTELYRLCLEAAQHVIDERRYADLRIPQSIVPLIERSWEEEPPSIYGRFDLAYDGSGPPKLLEFNADTPTSLLEAAVVQWYWLQDVFPVSDQFNSIHERLVAKWKDVAPGLTSQPLYFAGIDDREDWVTLSYLRDTAMQAGIDTAEIFIGDIGWHDGMRCFVDEQDRPIGAIFKLYPWEWLAREPFAEHLLEDLNAPPRQYGKGGTQWIEPAWKMLLSNKGILPILWELFPGHPNLLESRFDQGSLTSYVRKPLLSREGANVTIVDGATQLTTPGDYGEEGYIYQAVAPLSVRDGMHAVIGSWLVDGVASGIGIRESTGPVTDNLSRFVPHRMQ